MGEKFLIVNIEFHPRPNFIITSLPHYLLLISSKPPIENHSYSIKLRLLLLEVSPQFFFFVNTVLRNRIKISFNNSLNYFSLNCPKSAIFMLSFDPDIPMHFIKILMHLCFKQIISREVVTNRISQLLFDALTDSQILFLCPFSTPLFFCDLSIYTSRPSFCPDNP